MGFEPTKHYAQNLKSCPFDQTWVSRLVSMQRLLPFKTSPQNARLNIVQKVVISLSLRTARGNQTKNKKMEMKNMAMRSQIYEWTNLAPSGTGSTLSRNTADTSVAIASGTQVSVFTGGVGYNITKPAETTATQFVVIEDIACSPDDSTNNGGDVQIRINTTDYFQNPDVTSMSGVSGTASPYPRGISDGTNNLLKSFDLYPDVYVLPGQVWDVLFTAQNALAQTSTADCVSAFIKYTLYDGPDALIANKLLELGITVNPANVDWYKRTLIEQQAGGSM